MMAKRSFPEKSVGTVALALAGPSFIWGLHFAVVYMLQSVFCDVAGGSRAGDWARTGVATATVAALLMLLLPIARPDALLRMNRREASRPFLAGAMRLLALLSFLAVLWVGSAAFLLPACRSLA